MKINRLFLTLALTLLVGTANMLAQGPTIFNGIENPLPGNFASQPYQAQGTSEFGDRVQFAGSARSLLTVTQTMSSWGCESGHWNSGDCVTTPGATFSHPITLNIYNVGVGGSVGSLIGSVSQTFAIPFRPSASPICEDGRWYHAASSTCFNGYATNITFNLGNMVVPNQVIYSLAFNTSTYGAAPLGYSTDCFSTLEGCGYDSLNVALGDYAPTVGTDPAADDAYHLTLYGGCTGAVVPFGVDAGCWTGYYPSVKFTAANPPANANACKNNGWKTATRLDGSSFKNQGDCVSYVQNGK